jgi:hypothetical protein
MDYKPLNIVNCLTFFVEMLMKVVVTNLAFVAFNSMPCPSPMNHPNVFKKHSSFWAFGTRLWSFKISHGTTISKDVINNSKLNIYPFGWNLVNWKDPLRTTLGNKNWPNNILGPFSLNVFIIKNHVFLMFIYHMPKYMAWSFHCN